MKKVFPLKAWYAAARCGEVTHSLLARRICDKDVVLFRDSAGMVSALEDACWHRLVPLSKGWLEGDSVVCGYHGLRFNGQGRCTFMPSQETINPSACVRSYPVVERHGFTWLWIGDPAAADSALLPDQHYNADPDWVGDDQYAYVKSNYQLVIDNFMDLTHETFVHSSSIGDRAVAETPFDVVHGDRTVTVTRWMKAVENTPFWTKQLGKDGLVDRWQIVTYEAPSVVHIHVGVAPTGTGAPEGDFSQGISGQVLATVTPETATTSHLFWGFVRNYRRDDSELTAWLRTGLGPIFKEDEDIIEAQQRAVDENPDRNFYDLNIDAGSVWMRRLIERMIMAESEPLVQAAE